MGQTRPVHPKHAAHRSPHVDCNTSEYVPVVRSPEESLSHLDASVGLLEQAEDRACPIRQRVLALGLVSQKLDGFFSTRIPALRTQALAEVRIRKEVGYRRQPEIELHAIRKRVMLLVARQYRCWQDAIVPELAGQTVQVIDHTNLSTTQQRLIDRYFLELVYPTLTPMAIDASHPKPPFHDRALYVGALLRRRLSRGPRRLFAVVRLPAALPRFLPLQGGLRRQVVILEQVVGARLSELIGGYDVLDWTTFRFTRDRTASAASLIQCDYPTDRPVRADMVRLEVARGVSQRLLRTLSTVETLRFPLGHTPKGFSDVYIVPGPVDLSGVTELVKTPADDRVKSIRA